MVNVSSCIAVFFRLYSTPQQSICSGHAMYTITWDTPSGASRRAVLLLRRSTQSLHSHPTSIACRHAQIPAWPRASDKSDDCSPHRPRSHTAGFRRSWTPSTSLLSLDLCQSNRSLARSILAPRHLVSTIRSRLSWLTEEYAPPVTGS